jgi:hypothetical protein
MLRATWTHGRRGALLGASAAVVCVGAALAACGSGAAGGDYVAIGPAGGSPQPSGTAVRPTGSVTLVPLTTGSNSPESSDSSGPPPKPLPLSPSPPAPDTGATNPARTSPASPSPTPTPTTSRTPPSGPAALQVSDPVRKATDHRWCEDVTLAFHNTGGTAVRSGTVTLGTHIIDALGIDWTTINSTEQLPAPIAAGTARTKTWTVCVDAWRVPLGMHVETRDVSVQWR